MPIKYTWLVVDTFLNDYRKSLSMAWKAHHKGFSLEDWLPSKIDSKNADRYLSTIQYYKRHPYNKEFSIWIDDKLTLKYLCAGTLLDKYLPRYYFFIDNTGELNKLCDCPGDLFGKDYSSIATLLERTKELAFKLVSGSIGKGFYRATYERGRFFLNDREFNKDSFVVEISRLKGYLIIEFLRPHPEIARFCPSVTNTIRYLSADFKDEIVMIKSYIRFGTKKSGFVDNYNKGGVLCYVEENGSFSFGHILNSETGTDNIVYEHPDNQKKLSGTIPYWTDIKVAVQQFHDYFPVLKYLGFDFVITDKNEIKILEINSLTSLDALQLECSILDTKYGSFFVSN